MALVTGADSGIGRAVALAFAREGADVAIGYLESEDDARKTSALVEAAGRQALTISADIGSEAQAQALVEQTVPPVRSPRYPRQQRRQAGQGSGALRGPRWGTGRGDVPGQCPEHVSLGAVRLASHGSRIPHHQRGVHPSRPTVASDLDYASTKGAIVTFTKGLARSLVGRGIRVNCVAPRPVWTPLVVQSFSAEKNATFGQSSPLGRPAQPAELAPAFVFLACAESSDVSGEVLGVTGGKLLA